MSVLGREDFETAFTASNPDWASGSADNFSFGIEEVRLKSGDVIRPQLAGVTAIVGANNAGKSTILREVVESLQQHPSNPAPPRLSVESIGLAATGDPGDLFAWLLGNSVFALQGDSMGFTRPMAGFERPIMLAHYWDRRSNGLGGLAGYLCFYGNAAGRFSIGGSAEMRDSVDDPPSHPVHSLQDSRSLRDRVSTLSQSVFQRPLTLDTLARTIRLRVGNVETDAPPVDNIPRAYRESMANLRPLDEQGDGMRGFFGQVLPVVAATYPVIVLDEPEAFLHPPQAHALGVELGKLAVERKVQILIATHDRHILTGLLDSQVDVSIVRASRDADDARAYQLDAAELRGLWNDPVLHYSNVLDGLFHRVVVLAEAEGDCAYLSAAMDCPSRAPSDLPGGEVLFVATGGKAGMSKVASALKAIDVPVVAAPDLDMISNELELANLVRALGGDWDEPARQLWASATAAQRAPRDPVRVQHVLDSIRAALESRSDEIYTSDVRDVLLANARAKHSPWADVKDYGVDAFRGAARAELERLLERLEGMGIVMVRHGELERLAPEVAVRKGPGWLQAALAAGAQCNHRSQAHIDKVLGVSMRRVLSKTAITDNSATPSTEGE